MRPDPRRALLFLILALVALLALTIAWNWGPLRAGLDIAQVVASLRRGGESHGPLAAIAGFALASILAVPLIFLTIVSMIALGPVLGSITTLAGGAIGALVSFSLGKRLGADGVRQFAGERVNAISERLGRSGILAAAALRLVPVAPFAIVNMIAGTSHIRPCDFLLGNTLGMIPGTLIFALFVDQLRNAIENPGAGGLALLGVTLLLVLAGFWLARKWLHAH